ncbi:substrate-binding domain-containing protein [Actinoplanes sp. LDG1-06]|uniref:Substrate-binding domain-containing protein n=1 Tax=Paractinoplanes ovalisporus TaxID=2810368 RepID=A0ABS2ANV3_9ACTN|nr:substrate-binding domain-containing protein [Actinoplanes ovalisporus]MBM2620884.1 substrate-binding domain-containing protein [Actinoplanes ovalisporus]
MTPRRLTLAAVAVALGLSACSGPATPSASAPISAPPAPEVPAHHHEHSAGPAPSGAPGGTIVVHAADPLRDTLTKLVPRFEEAFPGAQVAVEYGAGLEHAQHILHGMPVDVFLSADEAATTMVTAAHDRGTPAVVARNPIVIALPPAGDRIAAIGDLRDAKVALCADTTPCGRGSRAALEAAAVDVRQPRVEPDAATALAQVRTGAADAALTYRTDVVAAGGDLRAVDFDQATRLADQYIAIRPSTGVNQVGADAFVAFLSSALAKHIFADAGLSPA